VGVQQAGDRAGVGEDAGDVGGGREAADAQRPAGEPDQLLAQVGQVDMTVGVFGDDHDVGDRLPPRQLVGVMLIRADEHHRPLRFRDARRQLVPFVQPGRDTQLQDADQLADRRGRPRPAEDDQVILGPAHRVMDHPPRVLPQAARLQPGPRALGVRVRVPRQHRVADEILDEIQRPPGGRVVGIGHTPRPERPIHQLTLTDDAPPDPLQQRRRRQPRCRDSGSTLSCTGCAHASPLCCGGQPPVIRQRATSRPHRLTIPMGV
jgi:hypothetical protein